MPPRVDQRARHGDAGKKPPTSGHPTQPPNKPLPSSKLSERVAGVESERFGADPKAGPPKAARKIGQG